MNPTAAFREFLCDVQLLFHSCPNEPLQTRSVANAIAFHIEMDTWRNSDPRYHATGLELRKAIAEWELRGDEILHKWYIKTKPSIASDTLPKMDDGD